MRKGGRLIEKPDYLIHNCCITINYIFSKDKVSQATSIC